MQERVPASRLQSIQSEIARLQSEKEKLEERCRFPLSVRDRIEQDIARLIQLDPANIKLKTDGLKVKARRLAREQIQERVKQLERETQNFKRKKDEPQEQLEIVERKLETLNSQLREVNEHLQQLEDNDPANVGVVLNHLRNSWKSIGQVELKKLIVKGEVERLYKEQLLLNYSIQIESKKANEIRQVLEIPIAETALLLEKNVLEQEKLERDLQRDLSRLSEIDARLKWLQTERQKLGWHNGNFATTTMEQRPFSAVMEPTKVRNPVLAAVLSFFFCGGGQLYIGQKAKGVILMLLFFFGCSGPCFLLYLVGLFMNISAGDIDPISGIFCGVPLLLLGLSIPVGSAIDAVMLCQRLTRGETLGEWDWFRTSGRDTFDKK